MKSTFNFPIHIHPEFELNYIENAKGAQRIVGDSVETITDEELVLIANPKLEHAWVNHECESKSIHEITIQFHESLIPPEMLDKNPFHSIRELFLRAQKGLVFGPTTIEKVKPLLKSVTYEPDGFYSVLKMMTILRELSLSSDARELASNSFINLSNNAEEDPRINTVNEFLHHNFSTTIKLADVASMVNMSEPSFCRFFKQRTSKNFVDFLTDIRIGAASRLLVDSYLPIADIGYSCGFNNLSNFNRVFKREKGIAPSEFRNSYRKKKVIV